MIKSLKKIHRIEKPDHFFERFEEKYGKGSIATFRKIIEDSQATLAEVGRHFGFSREYARLLYQKIYGFPYTETLREKREVLRKLKHEKITRLKAKRISFIARMIEMARFQGSTLEINGNPHNILINGYKINIKMASGKSSAGKNRYFGISRKKLRREACDFFICVCQENGNNTHYIIPYDVMPGGGINIPIHPERSKYLQFREAWRLLAKDREGSKICNRLSALL
jgi:hypothetical protein